MSNSQRDLFKDQDLRDISKRLKSNICEIKVVVKEIKELLQTTKRILKQLLQNGITNQELFFNVAPPAAPPDTPPAVTPTPIVLLIAKDIARLARQIRIKRQVLLEGILLATILLLSLELNLTDEVRASRTIELLSVAAGIETLTMEIQSLKDELEADVTILLAIAAGTID